MALLRTLVLSAIRLAPFGSARQRLFLKTPARGELSATAGSPLRVLVLGVYLADRPNSAPHLVGRFASTDRMQVEQRWMALNGCPEDAALAALSQTPPPGSRAKFVLINRMLRPVDLDRHDFVIICDDDIHVQAGFLEAFLSHQTRLGWAVAQPARAWHSHFDHLFVLRRPWLRARQTWFVECGPLVSFRRDAATLLMPFEGADQMWGLDFVWPLKLRQAGLKMGIVDAVAVDHSLRPQGSTYSKAAYDVDMHAFLARTPHLPMGEAFVVVERHRRSGPGDAEADVDP